jgi:hypothetical protein
MEALPQYTLRILPILSTQENPNSFYIFFQKKLCSLLKIAVPLRSLLKKGCFLPLYQLILNEL